MDKIDTFFDKVEKQGLGKAFNEITDIAHSEFGMSLGDMIEATVKSQKRPQCRIWCRCMADIFKHYIFEIRQNEDEEWTFICSFALKNDMFHYTMLEKIREMVNLGYEICFA